MTYDSRTDNLSGATTVIVGARQGRPNLAGAAGCPFCVGGLEAPDPYDVRSFPNRWPPIPEGRSEVVLYSPDHDASFASLGVDGVARVVALWSARTAELGARPDVAYVLPFENRGAAVGATISHPHGQLYAFPSVPEAALRELQQAGPCSLCVEADGSRLVSSSGGWRAVVPSAAAWPYELLVFPSDHEGGFGDPSGAAAVLVDALGRLDGLFGAPMPYMLWVHQRPTDGGDWPMAHVHVHVAPLWRDAGVPRFVAAGEIGSGVFFNPVEPAEAAARLRSVEVA